MALRLFAIGSTETDIPEFTEMRKALTPVGARATRIGTIRSADITKAFPGHGDGKPFGRLQDDPTMEIYDGTFDGHPVTMIKTDVNNVQIFIDSAITVVPGQDR